MSKPIVESREIRKARQISPLLRLALAFGVLAHLLGFLVFRVASDPLSFPGEDAAFITLVSTDTKGDAAELFEQASLFDSAPLFIPGEWSSAAEVFSKKIIQDWRNFPDFEPSIELIDEVRPARLPLSRVADVKQPSDFLDLHFWELFSYYGKEVTDVEALVSGSSVAIVTIMDGSEGYPADSERRLEFDLQSGGFAARPVVFVVNMSAPGFSLGRPLLKQSSGSDAVDAEVLEWLTRPATLAKLPAGFLELRVFP